MKQNPRDVINDIHERVADDETEHQVLTGYTEDPTLWGIDKKWLIILLLPGLVLFRVSTTNLTGANQLYGYAGSLALAGVAVLALLAAPDDLVVRDYLAALAAKYAHQQEMIHDSNPDESQLEQPKNDSLLGRVARLPLVRDWPIIGAGDYEPTQALIPHEKPIRGEHAIQREDGFIAGIEVEAIALRLASRGARKKVERAVANALEGTVDYHAQWISPTRKADYEHRRSEWKDRARAYQSEADRLLSGSDVEASKKAVRKQILADIADEVAAGVNLREETDRVQEHYLLVSVEPGEVVIDRSAEASGLGSVPVFRWFVKKYRLWKQGDSEEHEAMLIRKLERRATDLEAELNRIDGLTPNTLPADEFSEVIADYYRGTNVRAHADFTDAIRGSPVPDSEEAGDPEHEADYSHIANRDRAGSPPSPSPSPSSSATIHASADGGAVSPNEADVTAESDRTDSEQQTQEETNE